MPNERRRRVETQAERAERLKPYFALQLAFAEAVSKRLGFTFAESLFRFTNIHQQMGLGWADDARTLSPIWLAFVTKMQSLGSNMDRLQLIVEAVSHARQPLQERQKKFGCFSFDFEHDAPVKTVRIHFQNNDKSIKGPLSAKRLEVRKRELSEMFEYIQRWHPDAVAVSGRSWLYTREEYRGLFPPQYVSNMKLATDRDTFAGTSRWGQFLDSDGRVNRALAEKFLNNLKSLNRNVLGNVFPLKTFKPGAPIEAFFAFYNLNGNS